MNWLEVSLTVDGELAESVADVLARFAPNGVTMEQGVTFLDEEDEGTATGPVTVRAYLEINEQIEETRQRLEESLHYLGMIRPIPAPVYRQIADQNWMEAWKQNYRPIAVGRRLAIVPAWLESPDSERIAIRIDPGMAFGTGTHPTTQLCLDLLEAAADRRPLTTVIDVGCGSGILSIAALKLGAREALGVDIDREAVRNARENAEINGIGQELVLGQGSVGEVLEGNFPLRSAPLVLANILAPIIIRLLDAGLGEVVEPGGELILSGILVEQELRVAAAAAAKQLRVVDRRQMGDWVALMCQ
ncbi:MAG: 50S ribosomal protein L11 methyltransferase [Bacteroidota bacterium]